jgi:hypothetical protein
MASFFGYVTPKSAAAAAEGITDRQITLFGEEIDGLLAARRRRGGCKIPLLLNLKVGGGTVVLRMEDTENIHETHQLKRMVDDKVDPECPWAIFQALYTAACEETLEFEDVELTEPTTRSVASVLNPKKDEAQA